MNSTESRVLFYLTGRVRKGGSCYVAKTMGLPIVTQGKTENQAITDLVEATQLYVEGCLERGDIAEVLARHDWRAALQPPLAVPPGAFTLPVLLPGVVQHRLEPQRH